VYVHVRVRESLYERGSVFVRESVCVCMREIDNVCVSEGGKESERVSETICVRVSQREGERERDI